MVLELARRTRISKIRGNSDSTRTWMHDLVRNCPQFGPGPSIKSLCNFLHARVLSLKTWKFFPSSTSRTIQERKTTDRGDRQSSGRPLRCWATPSMPRTNLFFKHKPHPRGCFPWNANESLSLSTPIPRGAGSGLRQGEHERARDHPRADGQWERPCFRGRLRVQVSHSLPLHASPASTTPRWQ